MIGTGLAKCAALESLAASGGRRELPGQTEAFCVRAPRALRLAEHGVQGIDQIDGGGVRRADCLYGNEKIEAEQGSGPADGDGLGFHAGEPSGNALARGDLSPSVEDWTRAISRGGIGRWGPCEATRCVPPGPTTVRSVPTSRGETPRARCWPRFGTTIRIG